MHKDPEIRRAQYLAQQTAIAEQIDTHLIQDKLSRQTETLQQLIYKHQAKQEPLTRAIGQIQPHAHYVYTGEMNEGTYNGSRIFRGQSRRLELVGAKFKKASFKGILVHG